MSLKTMEGTKLKKKTLESSSVKLINGNTTADRQAGMDVVEETRPVNDTKETKQKVSQDEAEVSTRNQVSLKSSTNPLTESPVSRKRRIEEATTEEDDSDEEILIFSLRKYLRRELSRGRPCSRH